MVSMTLVRHATLLVELDGTRLLVDPMLSEAGANPPIEGTPNDRRNPLVDLPDGLADADWDVDALLLTHLHQDHLDDPARDRFGDAGLPVFCQPEDGDALAGTFEDVRVVEDELTFDGLTVTRTPARHGHGELAERMAPVCGFVVAGGVEGASAGGPGSRSSDGGERLDLAGDTVWYDGVRETLDAHDPTAVVLNAGAARFTEGRPITMTAEDVRSVCEHTDAAVLADHMGAINHCLLGREELTAALGETGHAEQVRVPDDGETVTL
jgi:L-ascorbate metabolism protein UlaG (beta-lactamase superfamily)